MKNKYLSLGGLFIALHLIFILLSRVLVGSELILVLFLPLLSTIYSLKFNLKEVAMFFIATLLLCVIFEPISTLIYVLPSLICGTLYGILRKKKMKELSLIYISSLSHAFTLLLSFFFIGLMFENIEFIDIFKTFIKKDNEALMVSIYYILILLGLIESFLVHIISNSELKKLGYEEVKKEECTPSWMVIGLVISLLVYSFTMFINPFYSLYLLPFIFSFSVPMVVEFVLENKYKWLYLLVGLTFVCSIFMTNYVDKIAYPFLIILIILPILMEKFVRVLYTFLVKYSNKG